MRSRIANFDVDLVGYNNPTGLWAVQIDGEGPLILPNGKRIPEGHRAWSESLVDVSMRDLSRKQVQAIEDAIEAQRRNAIRLQLEKKRKEEELEQQRLLEEQEAQLALERRRERRLERERREMARSNRAIILWDNIIEEIWKDTEKGVDAVDMFYGWADPGWRNRPDPDDFRTQLSGAAGDVGWDYEHALSDKAEKLHDRYMDLAKSEGYLLGERGLPSSPREVRERLRDLYADAWASGAFKEFTDFQNSSRYPEAVAEKYIGWGQWRKLSPVLKKRVLHILKKKIDTESIQEARAAVGWTP